MSSHQGNLRCFWCFFWWGKPPKAMPGPGNGSWFVWANCLDTVGNWMCAKPLATRYAFIRFPCSFYRRYHPETSNNHSWKFLKIHQQTFSTHDQHQHQPSSSQFNIIQHIWRHRSRHPMAMAPPAKSPPCVPHSAPPPSAAPVAHARPGARWGPRDAPALGRSRCGSPWRPQWKILEKLWVNMQEMMGHHEVMNIPWK